MAKWILLIAVLAGTAWFFKDSIKKLIWKFKHKKHDWENKPDADCWFCKEALRKKKEQERLLNEK